MNYFWHIKLQICIKSLNVIIILQFFLSYKYLYLLHILTITDLENITGKTL